MRKFSIIIIVAMLTSVAGISLATDLAAVEGSGQARVIKELQNNNNHLVAGTRTLPALGVTGALTGASVTVTGEATVDTKYAIVGGDATTGLMVQAASITAVGTAHTNTFAAAFGAAPVVTISYTEDPGDVQPLYLGTITASNFICTVTSSKNFSYTAVGARP